MKAWITTTVMVANTAAIAFLVWMQLQDRETESMKAIEEQVRKNTELIEANNSEILQELQTIRANADTIQIIREKLKTHETVYYRNLGYVLQLDSSERAVQYARKLREGWNHFQSGHEVYFPGQSSKRP